MRLAAMPRAIMKSRDRARAAGAEREIVFARAALVGVAFDR